jgi:hypothetical protein
MARRYELFSMLVLLCLALCGSGAWAGWVANGVPVCNADYEQWGPRMVQDGPDGAIVIWLDNRSGSEPDIYGNRIGTDGTIWAGLGGVPVCTAVGSQYDAMVISADTGDVIVAWLDARDGAQRLYAQKVDTGTCVWTPDGIDVCPSAAYLYYARMAPDGAGGAIFTWYENRFGSYDIFAQRIDADGNLVWGPDGIDVCASAGDQYNPEITADGSGGAIIAWWDYRDGIGDIYAQRVDGDGNLLWDTDGVPVCTDGSEQKNPRLVAASGGGTFVIWSDARTGYEQVFAQWIDEDGASLWQIDGVPVTATSSYNYSPRLMDDGSGGVIVAWYDNRSGNPQVYAQRFDSDGNTAWGSNGIMLMDAYSYSYDISMVTDGLGGAIVTADISIDEDSPNHIYAQRVDRDGNVLWGPRAAVCLAPGYQYGPDLAPDGSGGAIVAWEDRRAGDGYSDLYCQRMSPSGLWGNPEPEIISCADLPQDQGGWIRIKTRASSHDIAGEIDSPIRGYNVWRMIGGGGPKAVSAGAAGASMGDRAKLLALLADPATAKSVRVSGPGAIALGLPPGDWESVGFWFATRDTVYNIAVPTKNDSTEAGTAEETFLVTAHSSIAGVFAASEPAMGYSVDNLAPGVTPGFAGNETESPHGLALSWTPNSASDMWKYDVHRGDDDTFVPDESNRLGTTDGTYLFDPSWVKAYQYFYKLVAVDRHGNASPAALLRPEDVKVGTMLQSFAATLAGSVAEISWKLSGVDETAEFRVLREIAGSGFAELASAEVARDGASYSFKDATLEPGTTYRYRVDVVEGAGSRTLFETDAISTPAMPLALNQNHPNPFNPSTTIGYYLPVDSPVTLEVYDSAGRLVARLLDGVKQAKGPHSVEWRGLDAQGRSASSGLYFYRLRNGTETISRKMILLR